MKILLTGSSGFLGKVLFQRLNTLYSVKTLARNNSDYNVDLSTEENIIFSEKFELVIHAAGIAHKIPINQSEVNLMYNSNVTGTTNLLKALERRIIPKRFVYISSVSVYGLNEGILINENNPLLALDPYGKSKIEAERIVCDWCYKHNICCTILRLPLVVGPNAPGNLRSMILGIKQGYYFNISGGIAKKSMVLANDVADYLIRASEIGGIYNLTDGYHPSFYELSQEIMCQVNRSKVYNLPKTLAIILSFLGDLIGSKFPINSKKYNKITSSLTFDDSAARISFGWNPKPILSNFRI